MTDTMTIDTQQGEPLKQRWLVLREAEPQLRALDAAERLGVSEGELVGCRCGDGVRRLRGPWGELIEALPELGRVMVLTRNDQCAHEKKGRFGKISIFGDRMGLVLNRDIDLRLFLGHWHFGFAVSEEAHGDVRRSLQFFDRDGTAVHKVHLLEDSDGDAYQRIVTRFLSPDQTGAVETEALSEPDPDRPDAEIDAALLRDRWQALQDVHDFRDMLDTLGAGRVQALRLVGEDFAWRVDNKSFRRAVSGAAARGTPIMVFVGSPGVVQIHTGQVKTLRDMGPWFNILDPDFNLHLREDLIVSSWVVRKPTREGIVTSLEIYDDKDRQIAWLFGERGEGKAERQDWRTLVESLERAGA
jgi:putative hemin transport protein